MDRPVELRQLLLLRALQCDCEPRTAGYQIGASSASHALGSGTVLESFLVYYLCFGEAGEDSEMELKDKVVESHLSLSARRASLTTTEASGDEKAVPMQVGRAPSELSTAISDVSIRLQAIKQLEVTTRQIDYFSRRFFPLSYIFALSLLLATEANDEYDRDYTVDSYTGMWPEPRVRIWPLPTVTVLFILAFCCFQFRDKIRVGLMLVQPSTRSRGRELRGPA